MPAFIMSGSMIMPAIFPACSSSARSRTARSLNGTTTTRSTMACGMPPPAATDHGRSRGPRSSASLYIDTMTASWCPW